MSASQQKTLSIYNQLELIDDVKVKRLKLAAAAKKYGIGYSTAAKILKKEDDLRSCMQINGNTNRKRLVFVIYDQQIVRPTRRYAISLNDEKRKTEGSYAYR